MTAWLTIDDGPSRDTPGYLDALAERGIAPVLFFWGQRLESAWAEGVDAVRRGVLIGNHSYSHMCYSQATYDACIKDIHRQEALLDRLYQEAGVVRPAKLMRFPYGDAGGAHEAALQAYLLAEGFVSLDRLGRADTLWTFDPQEYRLPHEADWMLPDVLARVETLRGVQAHQLILIHDHPETDAAYPGYFLTIIDAMLAAGVTFTAPSIT